MLHVPWRCDGPRRTNETARSAFGARAAASSRHYRDGPRRTRSCTAWHHGRDLANGAPALAAAQGIATQHHEPGGAGDYIAVEHGGGWKTYYFHLQAFSVGDGEMVGQGQEVGKVGSTGASSGPHLHFEQLLNGEGKDIVIDGVPLAPYPGSYFQQSLTSNNCPDAP